MSRTTRRDEELNFRRRFVFIGLGPALAVSLFWPSRAAAQDWFDQRTQVIEEVTANSAGQSLFNPGGRVFPVDSIQNLLRLNTDWTFKLPLQFTLKTKLAGEQDNGSDSTHESEVRELYVNRSLGSFDISIGRKILKWSNGYAFNPAGLLDPPRLATDPQDRLDRNKGQDLIQIDYYHGSQTLTAAFGSTGFFSGGATDQNTIFALRYNAQFHGVDFALMGGVRPKGSDVAAMTFSDVLGDHLEIHGEAAGTRGSDILLPRSILPGNQDVLFGGDFFAPVRSGDDRLFLRYLLGFNYTFSNGVNAVGEYYHDDQGLTSSEWQRFLSQAQFSRRLAEAGGFPPVFEGYSLPELNLLQAASILGQSGIRRDYLFIRFADSWRRNEIGASLLALLNMHDDSFVVTPEVTLQFQRHALVYVRGTFAHGSRASEFGNIPIGSSGNLGIRVFF